eukprot:970667-Prymnesium_polylepis.1
MQLPAIWHGPVVASGWWNCCRARAVVARSEGVASSRSEDTASRSDSAAPRAEDAATFESGGAIGSRRAPAPAEGDGSCRGRRSELSQRAGQRRRSHVCAKLEGAGRAPLELQRADRPTSGVQAKVGRGAGRRRVGRAAGARQATVAPRTVSSFGMASRKEADTIFLDEASGNRAGRSKAPWWLGDLFARAPRGRAWAGARQLIITHQPIGSIT